MNQSSWKKYAGELGARCAKLEAENEVLARRLEGLQAVVDSQAEDEGCWFIAVTAPEAYLQQELRRLHTAVESARP